MNISTQVSNKSNYDDITDFNQLSSQKRSAIDIFKNTLNFLSFVMNRQNISQEQYSTIHDKFISKPHSLLSSFEDFSKDIIPMIYNHSNSLEQLNDVNEYLNYSPNLVNKTEMASDSLPSSNTQMCFESGLDTIQLEKIKNVSFWMEGVFQLTIGFIGITSNLAAIPILCVNAMKSIFNKLLICLLLIHTVYLFGVLLMGIMWPEWKSNDKKLTEVWFIVLFSFVVYPLQQLMLYSSTFITTLMARQRYLAIRHPIEYRNSTIATNPWIPAMKHLILVLSLSGVLCIPLFLETSIKHNRYGTIKSVNKTHFQYVLEKETTITLQPIRLNWHYVLWYRNVTVMIVSIMIPLILLAYWNFNTFSVILRRQRLQNRPTICPEVPVNIRDGLLDTGNRTNSYDSVVPMSVFEALNTGQVTPNSRRGSRSEQIKREEARKAHILFAIVFFFVVCNVPRIILNMEELVTILRSYWKVYSITLIENNDGKEHGGVNIKKHCYTPPFWAHILKIISKLLLTINASVGCFVYCIMSPQFREEISKKLQILFNLRR